MTDMVAKLVISSVTQYEGQDTLKFRAVCKADGYDDTGKDENNTFSLYTPSADLEMNINNPELLGKYKPGDTYLVNFTKVE